jgi:hypothetical protein
VSKFTVISFQHLIDYLYLRAVSMLAMAGEEVEPGVRAHKLPQSSQKEGNYVSTAGVTNSSHDLECKIKISI